MNLRIMKKPFTLRAVMSVLCFAISSVFAFTGCSTSSSTVRSLTASTNAPAAVEPLKLREGDIVRIEFPAAPNLNAREVIKRDGKISLQVGEVTAAGKTLSELQTELLELYGPQLVTKLLVVNVEASVFPVYVTGAVEKNGKLTVDRPMTVLEAVLEAGVDINHANLKGVRLTRNDNGTPEVFELDLDRQIRGKTAPGEAPFYVKPSDIIYVPQKFQWF